MSSNTSADYRYAWLKSLGTQNVLAKNTCPGMSSESVNLCESPNYVGLKSATHPNMADGELGFHEAAVNRPKVLQ